MCGDDRQPDAVFSYVSMESRIPQDHPLRAMRALVDACLCKMSPRFTQLYARTGRPSISPEKLLRAQLLQVLYTVRSERLLMEQLDYNLLFRWFVGLTMDDAVWDATVFTKNRERLLAGDVARGFLEHAGSWSLITGAGQIENQLQAFEDAVVLSVRADPEPSHLVVFQQADGTISQRHAY